MSDQTVEEPSLTRKISDAALLIVAFAAISMWLWRRVRRPASVDQIAASDLLTIDDRVGAAVGVPGDASPK